MDYIDVDNDSSTFNSSMATLDLPDCSTIEYAGLYWAGINPYDTWEDQGTANLNIDDVKFRLPGGIYQDITADEIIYNDGDVNQRPYVCYKDVTAMVTALGAAAEGDYFIADVKATTGYHGSLGSSAGWTMVVIYSDPTETSKNISIFDGFSTIDGTNDAEITFSGFETIPEGPDPANPAPVRVQLLTCLLYTSPSPRDS